MASCWPAQRPVKSDGRSRYELSNQIVSGYRRFQMERFILARATGSYTPLRPTAGSNGPLRRVPGLILHPPLE